MDPWELILALDLAESRAESMFDKHGLKGIDAYQQQKNLWVSSLGGHHKTEIIDTERMSVCLYVRLMSEEMV